MSVIISLYIISYIDMYAHNYYICIKESEYTAYAYSDSFICVLKVSII